MAKIRKYDPRKDLDEKLNQQAIRADDAKMRYVMGGKAKYKGSKLEAEHRKGKK